MHASEIPDVLRVRITPVLLGGVARERGDLALDVPLLQRDIRAVGEIEVVPGNLVPENGRPLERTQALLRDRLVILVNVVMRGLEDDLGPPFLPEPDEELEDVLATLGERAYVEVVDRQTVLGNADLGRRFANFPRERVRLEAGGQRTGRDRERDVPHLASAVDEPRHRSTAAELAVVGMRREDERTVEAVEHRAIQ